MEAFFEFLGVVAVCVAAIVIAFGILVALPRSPMRDFLLRLSGRLGATAAAGVYALSPIDAIPDFIPALGQADDIGVLLLLLYYWYTFFVSPQTRPQAKSGGGRVIDVKPVK